MKHLFSLFSLSILLLYTPLNAAYSYDNDSATALREMRDTIDMLRHEISNHETEMKMMEERIDNQESTIASLRQQILDANQANKELVKGQNSTIDGKMTAIESSNKGLTADLLQLKTHANDSSTALTQYKQEINDLKKNTALQSKNIDNLQAALKSLTEVLQTSEGGPAKDISSNDGKSYRVKPGDTLEKIARAHSTTVKAIKENNNLSNDRINVGQTLQIP